MAILLLDGLCIPCMKGVVDGLNQPVVPTQEWLSAPTSVSPIGDGAASAEVYESPYG